MIFLSFPASFFNKKQRGGKYTEKEKPGGGWNGRKRGARKLRLRRYGTVRPVGEQDGGGWKNFAE